MTTPAFAKGLGGTLPSSSEKAAANKLRKILAAHAGRDVTLRVPDDAAKPCEVTLTPSLSNILMEVLCHIGRGDAVTVVPVGQMLNTQQAADILNVSRPFLISLLEKGEIEHMLVGRHRRIRAENLFAYKQARDFKRSDALAAMGAADGEFL